MSLRGELDSPKKISNTDWHKMLAAKTRVDHTFAGKWAEQTDPNKFVNLEDEALDQYVNKAADRMLKTVGDSNKGKRTQDAPFQEDMQKYARELIRQQILAHQEQVANDMYDDSPHKMKRNIPTGDLEKSIVAGVNKGLVNNLDQRYDNQVERYKKDKQLLNQQKQVEYSDMDM